MSPKFWQRDIGELMQKSRTSRFIAYAFCFLFPCCIAYLPLTHAWQSFQTARQQSISLVANDDTEKWLATWQQQGIEIINNDQEWTVQADAETWANILPLLSSQAKLLRFSTDLDVLHFTFTPSPLSEMQAKHDAWHWHTPAFFSAEHLEIPSEIHHEENDDDDNASSESNNWHEIATETEALHYRGYMHSKQQFVIWIEYQQHLHRLKKGQNIADYRLIAADEHNATLQHRHTGQKRILSLNETSEESNEEHETSHSNNE